MSAPRNNILLIPSATLVPDELRLDVGSIPTGMIPLQGKPMLERIADAYGSSTASNVVAVNQRADLIRRFADRSIHSWNVIETGETNSVGETVLYALEQLDSELIANSKLFVHFADTLTSPIKPDDEGDFISFKREDRSYRWTTFDIKDGRVDSVYPKNSGFDSGHSPTFIGQFGISHPKQFLQCLRDYNGQHESVDMIYGGLLSYLSGVDYSLYEPESWLDVGHLDTYHKSKKEFLNTREFNNLEVTDKNLIIKKSENVDILLNEIQWYNQIPSSLQPYLPRLYDWSTDESDVYLHLEYVGYPALSDLQLYGSHGVHIWNSIFHRILSIVDEFGEYSSGATSDEIQNALHGMYLSKTHRRMESLWQSGGLEGIDRTERISVNGSDYPSVDYLQEQIADLVQDSEIFELDELSIIHGDLCFPNILYEPRNEIVKLIDPRGEFGQFTIYGDPRYDLAKLRHSVVGNYEHLINGQFSSTKDSGSNSISYDVYTSDEQIQRMSRFDSLINSHSNFDIETIKLIEALLFLSMVPLHRDDSDRQLCMLAKGVEKIAPFLK